jgi:glucoamylase
MSDDTPAWPDRDAPGAPGIAPTWTSSRKDLVGTTLGPGRVWYTLGYGILNEVYYPRVDIPQIRDLGFIVADGSGFWCEVKRLGSYDLSLPGPGIPAPTIVHRHDRFELELRIAPDPIRDVLLVAVRLSGEPALKPYVLLAPHLGGTGKDNIAAVGRHYGHRVLWAEQGPFGLALAAVDPHQSDAFSRLSAGYVGTSDGWQDFARNGAMSWTHERAGPGNVALLGELQRDSVLALGLASSRGAAASLAAAALAEPFEQPWDAHVSAWQEWHAKCHGAIGIDSTESELDAQFHTSRMVLRCHMDKINPGAMVASLSVPWGSTRDDRAGYHLVWPRDLVQCATALLGVGGEAEAQDVLRYLIATQYEDGHWNQNQWLGGTPFWQGVQLDETALPVILAVLLQERAAIDGIEVVPMIRRALGFIARMGPVTDQDRWEEDRGLNAFTLAATITALASGAAFLTESERAVALDIADDWDARLESWLYVEHSELARQAGVRGHYVRVAPPDMLADPGALDRVLPINNRNPDPGLTAANQISGDFLQLVRFGLRSHDDPRIRDTLTVSDRLLRVETPSGLAWHRYNEDGYGEHPDGSAYDGTGRGRAWPLLTGERGHYETLAGNDPQAHLRAMVAMSGRGGMLPEQIWDDKPIPERRLFPGQPTGSAMPLAWAHAEFVKLMLSSQLGHAFDCPQAMLERQRNGPPSRSVWSERAPASSFFAGSDLRVNLGCAAEIAWRADTEAERRRTSTRESLPGVHSAVLPTKALAADCSIEFEWKPTGSSSLSERHTVTAKSR